MSHSWGITWVDYRWCLAWNNCSSYFDRILGCLQRITWSCVLVRRSHTCNLAVVDSFHRLRFFRMPSKSWMNFTRRTWFGRFFFCSAIPIDVQSIDSKVSLGHSLEVVMYYRSSSLFVVIHIYCNRSVVTMQSYITMANFEEGMKGAVGRSSKKPS